MIASKEEIYDPKIANLVLKKFKKVDKKREKERGFWFVGATAAQLCFPQGGRINSRFGRN